MINIGGHTFDETILKDGVIIDIGCRDFTFADYFEGKAVYCVDVDSKVFEGVNKPHTLLNLAISDKTGESGYYENGEGTCLKDIDPDQGHPFKPCKTITMEDLYKITGENVDILKLDCEGAEYIILGETFKPIPKQISVEMHHHCVPDLHNKHYQSIVERLSKDYTMHNDVWEQRHGCGYNFWDTLFIRKWQ
jgi:FkbM family methyltransferase